MLIVRNIVLIIILGIITFTDFKRQEIDNEPLLLGLLFAVLFSLAGFNDVSVKSSIIGFFLGGGIFALLAFWGMGGGDVKLMAVLGYFLGWKNIILVMFLSFAVGVVFSLFYMLVKKKGLKSCIPFGPSIAIATVLVLFYGQQITNNCEFLWFLR